MRNTDDTSTSSSTPMRIYGVVIAVMCGACSIYGGDDAPAEVDGGVVEEDAGIPSMVGEWSVAMTCTTAACATPFAEIDRAYISDDTAAVRLEWATAGASGPAFVHPGSFWRGTCVTVGEGDDGGVERATYDLCLRSTGTAVGLITWGESTWRVDLTRL